MRHANIFGIGVFLTLLGLVGLFVIDIPYTKMHRTFYTVDRSSDELTSTVDRIISAIFLVIGIIVMILGLFI